jgi:L-alanine-DL-glutamate epimerase-like enolase superfamily enzyme
LVASLAKGFFVEYRTADTPLMSAILKDPPKLEDGYIRVPDKPGLGIELNEQTIEKYRV